MIEQRVQPFSSHYPLEIQELASPYRLGALIATYRGGFTRHSITGIIIGVLFAIPSGAAMVLAIDASRTSMDYTALFSMPFMTLVLFVLLSIVLLWLSIGPSLQQKRHWRVYVFDHGFIFTKGKQPDIFCWEEIRTIWWEESRYYRDWKSILIDVIPCIFYIAIMCIFHLGEGNEYYRDRTPTTHIHTYTIERFDRHRVVLDNRIHKVKELGTTIGEQVANTLWPQTLAAYNAGNIISFGPLSMSRQGISKGNNFLPWPALKEIVISGEELKIHQHGKRLNWSSVRLDKVPNVFLLLALSRFVMGR